MGIGIKIRIGNGNEIGPCIDCIMLESDRLMEYGTRARVEDTDHGR
jgi:hypothetical protein